MNNTNDIQSTSWWNISKEKILDILKVNPQQGLSEKRVSENRFNFGSNEIIEIKPKTIATLIVEGIKEPMMLLLLSIAGISLLFGKFIEAFAMIFVVVAYISVELINKFRTDRIMVKLKSLAYPKSKVIRDGKQVEIDTKDIVVGDILILSEGVFIPVDARLIDAYGLLVDEASLTGESLYVSKDSNAIISKAAPLGDRINCVFAGTSVIGGEGTAIVCAVGQQSSFGRIAQEVQEVRKEKTVLQKSMTKLAKVLAIFALIASAIIPLIGFLRGLEIQEMVLTWLSLTFLMIPGQPPIIITMALVLAAFQLAKKQVIVKRLRGVEVIGQVTSIVSDKTGTITQSTMIAEKFLLANGTETLQLPKDTQEMIALALPDFCNDPTDKAVLDAIEQKKKDRNQIDFIGFADNRPWRDLIYNRDAKFFHAFAGSPEFIIEHSTLSSTQKQHYLAYAMREARQGKRVTSYAYSQSNSKEMSSFKNVHFVALAVIKDPVRKGVKSTIEILEKAGITTFIVTGDHKDTAQSIAAEIGIVGDIITGDQFEKMSDEQIIKTIGKSNIFARMDPSQKLRLVSILQKKGEIVAAIGDGVNDAPALKLAQVGIAMGQIGTDLAKEVSDLILTDDNYIHIPDAVAIGRTAIDNFKKGISYYLSAKVILLSVFIVPLFLGIPFPFVPIQIICIELLMDLASSTIFVTEAPEPDVMLAPMESIKKFLGRPLVKRILQNAIGLTIGILAIYFYAYAKYDIVTAQTAAFVTWLLGHILLALNLKQERIPLAIQGFFSNYFGIFWLLGMVALSVIITNIAWLFPYLRTTWLPLPLWSGIIVIIIISTFWIEFVKLIRFRKTIS